MAHGHGSRELPRQHGCGLVHPDFVGHRLDGFSCSGHGSWPPAEKRVRSPWREVVQGAVKSATVTSVRLSYFCPPGAPALGRVSSIGRSRHEYRQMYAWSPSFPMLQTYCLVCACAFYCACTVLYEHSTSGEECCNHRSLYQGTGVNITECYCE